MNPLGGLRETPIPGKQIVSDKFEGKRSGNVERMKDAGGNDLRALRAAINFLKKKERITMFARERHAETRKAGGSRVNGN